jgi:two-component system, sensor histidine kinase and response regulator
LDIIAESAIEMGKLIDAILSFSRLSRGELNLSRINSNDIVKKVIKSFDTEISGRNIEFIQSDLSEIMGDENLINQVWVNLISNAFKYTSKKEKAIIEIGCKPENDMIVFFIKDNGAGFDMTYATKLFGVFQRLHKAKDFEGIGIGLANINRIILRHKGKCWAEGEVDKGATFYFSLPNII